MSHHREHTQVWLTFSFWHKRPWFYSFEGVLEWQQASPERRFTRLWLGSLMNEGKKWGKIQAFLFVCPLCALGFFFQDASSSRLGAAILNVILTKGFVVYRIMSYLSRNLNVVICNWVIRKNGAKLKSWKIMINIEQRSTKGPKQRKKKNTWVDHWFLLDKDWLMIPNSESECL